MKNFFFNVACYSVAIAVLTGLLFGGLAVVGLILKALGI